MTGRRGTITVRGSGADAAWEQMLSDAKRYGTLEGLSLEISEAMGEMPVVVGSGPERIEIDPEYLCQQLDALAGSDGAPVVAMEAVTTFLQQVRAGRHQPEPGRQWWEDVSVTGLPVSPDLDENKSWSMYLAEAKRSGDGFSSSSVHTRIQTNFGSTLRGCRPVAEMVSLNLLQPHPHNPRRSLDSEYIAELAASMQEQGQWEAIQVRPIAGGLLQIVAGHCRVEAARSLGWEEIRAEVQDLTDEQADFLALDTNLKRKSLSEMEEAEAIRLMRDKHGWTQGQIAKRFSKTQFWVSYRLNLLKAHPEVQKAVIERSINATQAAEIAKAPTELQPTITQKVHSADLSTRETERLVKVVTDPATPPDVRQAALENTLVTPDHAAAIAKAPDPVTRQGLIKAAEAGQITPQEAEREAEAAARRAEAPLSFPLVKAERRTAVLGQTRKAEDALEEITQRTVVELDHSDLTDLDYALQRLANRVQQISTWVVMLRDKQRSKPQAAGGKVFQMPKR